MADARYTAERIGAALARNTFKGALCVVDRCTKMGSECDLLVIDSSLRAVDVEIKISRADLKADRDKGKWFDFQRWDPATRDWAKTPREWPQNIWKHYYVVAAPIWCDELLEHCQPKSGVITITMRDKPGPYQLDYELHVRRRATPNRNCEPLKPDVIADVARLASLRMWDAYRDLQTTRADRDLALRRGVA